MSLANAEIAVRTAVASALTGWTIDSENAAFTPPAGKWASVRNIVADKRIETTSTAGFDRYTGITVVNLNYPAGSGYSTFASDFTTLESAFKSTTRLTYSGQPVSIERCFPAATVEGKQWYTKSVRIYWTALVQRS